MTRKLLILSFAFLGIVNCAIAQTFRYVKPNGTGDGSSWANAAGNIQDMIDASATNDQVWVAAGTYYPTTQTSDDRSKRFQLKNGVHLYGGFAGNETNIADRAKSDTDGNGTVEDWEFTNETVLSGNVDGINDVWSKQTVNSAWYWRVTGNNGNCYYVVDCGDDVDEETILDGFTVSGGRTGVFTYGNTIIQNCIITKNSTLATTGGVYKTRGTVTNCYIHTNSGTGIYNATGTVSNCRIESNANYRSVTSYTTISGGGVNNVSGIIVNCVVMNNQVYLSQAVPNSDSSAQAYGGGIYNNSGRIDKCIVANNSVQCNNVLTTANRSRYSVGAFASGGGIYDKGGIISNCCVFNNSIAAAHNSTRAGSANVQEGAGIYTVTASALYNSTIVNNQDQIRVGETNLYPIFGGTPVNCITSRSSGFIRSIYFSGRATTAAQEAEILNADWRLSEGSSNIGAGTLEGLPEWLVNGTDLAGNPRTTNGTICRGAYEYESTVSNEAIQQTDIAVFPNPVTSQLHVKYEAPESADYTIYNVSGQIIMQGKLQESSIINVASLTNGLYYLRIATKTVKFIKQ